MYRDSLPVPFAIDSLCDSFSSYSLCIHDSLPDIKDRKNVVQNRCNCYLN